MILAGDSLAGKQQAVRLVAQIHDELLFEANTKLCDVYVVAGELPPPPLTSFSLKRHVFAYCRETWCQLTLTLTMQWTVIQHVC